MEDNWMTSTHLHLPGLEIDQVESTNNALSYHEMKCRRHDDMVRSCRPICNALRSKLSDIYKSNDFDPMVDIIFRFSEGEVAGVTNNGFDLLLIMEINSKHLIISDLLPSCYRILHDSATELELNEIIGLSPFIGFLVSSRYIVQLHIKISENLESGMLTGMNE